MKKVLLTGIILSFISIQVSLLSVVASVLPCGHTQPKCDGTCPEGQRCAPPLDPKDFFCRCVPIICGNGIIEKGEKCDPPGGTNGCEPYYVCNNDCSACDPMETPTPSPTATPTPTPVPSPTSTIPPPLPVYPE